MGDPAYRVEYSNLSPKEAKELLELIVDTDKTGRKVLNYEYTLETNNPYIPAKTLVLSFSGGDVVTYASRITSVVFKEKGLSPSLENAIVSDADSIKSAVISYKNSPQELNVSLDYIKKSGARCMTGKDSRELESWLKANNALDVVSGK